MRWPWTRQPATALPGACLAADIDRGIADARARRLAREGTRQHRRFERARPKVEQLRAELAMQMVDF